MVAERLAHLHFAIRTGQDAQDDGDVRLLAQVGHQLARGGFGIGEGAVGDEFHSESLYAGRLEIECASWRSLCGSKPPLNPGLSIDSCLLTFLPMSSRK